MFKSLLISLSLVLFVSACSHKKDQAGITDELSVTETTFPDGTTEFEIEQAYANASNGKTVFEDIIFEGNENRKPVHAHDRVFFAFDSSVVSAIGQSTLDRQSAYLKDNSGVAVTVEGHCDERGTREYNLALGERRASAVKSYLTSSGVDSSRVQTISYGKDEPVVLGSSPAVWAENRVAITVPNNR